MSSLVPSSIAALRACWVPSAGGMCCHATNVQSAGVVLNEDQHVDAPEQDRVDGQEVTRDDALRLGGQELFPRRARSARGWLKAGCGQDLPDRRRRDPVAESGQLTVDAAMSPQRILGGHIDDELADAGRGGRAARAVGGWCSPSGAPPRAGASAGWWPV
jgi:hypothetical protein